jgi:hypothetical protein
MPAEQAKVLAEALSEGRWTHDHPIFPDEAVELGLQVTTDMPESILELMSLFAQPSRRPSGVEYLPQPHRDGAGRSP